MYAKRGSARRSAWAGPPRMPAGAESGVRTRGLCFTRAPLCQLSYLGEYGFPARIRTSISGTKIRGPAIGRRGSVSKPPDMCGQHDEHWSRMPESNRLSLGYEPSEETVSPLRCACYAFDKLRLSLVSHTPWELYPTRCVPVCQGGNQTGLGRRFDRFPWVPSGHVWRRAGDSNPEVACAATRFPSALLSHSDSSPLTCRTQE